MLSDAIDLDRLGALVRIFGRELAADPVRVDWLARRCDVDPVRRREPVEDVERTIFDGRGEPMVPSEEPSGYSPGTGCPRCCSNASPQEEGSGAVIAHLRDLPGRVVLWVCEPCYRDLLALGWQKAPCMP